MITCNIMGGLGNQLFQICATIGYAMSRNKPFIFPRGKGGTPNRPTYWDNFLAPLQIFLRTDETIRMKSYRIHNEDPFQKYNGEWRDDNDKEEALKNVYLKGYYQSYKYFDCYYKTIIRLLRLEEQKTNTLNKYGGAKDNYISMHFRLGDYKSLPNHHPILSADYYKKSLETILSMDPINISHVLVFCEEEDETKVKEIIQECVKTELKPELKWEIIDHSIPDWEQLLLMSLCRHNIIANSTFSWWGAYFNEHQDKIVCYPSVWFGPALSYVRSTEDLFPPSWTKI